MLFLGFRKEIFLDLLIIQGIVGAIVTFVFPDITDFPFTYDYIRFFLSHSILYITPVYFIIIEGKRIDKRILKLSFLSLHIFAIIAIVLNLVYGTKYMYISPNNSENLYAFLPVHEAIPFLGNWPAILLFGEALAIPVYLAVYFIIRKLQKLL